MIFDALMPAVENQYRVDGEVRSMLAMVSALARFANVDQLEEAGIAPSSIKTATDLLDSAERINAETGSAGLTFHQNAWYMEQFAAMTG